MIPAESGQAVVSDLEVYMQVRFARETSKVQPTTEPNDKNMLFFSRAAPKATEQDIKEVFAEHGEASLPPSPWSPPPPALSSRQAC